MPTNHSAFTAGQIFKCGISLKKKAYFQLSNVILLLKIGREIMKAVISSSPEMSSTAQLAQGRTETLYGVKRRMKPEAMASNNKPKKFQTLRKMFFSEVLKVS